LGHQDRAQSRRDRSTVHQWCNQSRRKNPGIANAEERRIHYRNLGHSAAKTVARGARCVGNSERNDGDNILEMVESAFRQSLGKSRMDNPSTNPVEAADRKGSWPKMSVFVSVLLWLLAWGAIIWLVPIRPRLVIH